MGSKSGFLAGILLLTVRGVLLWVALPMGCIAWVLGTPRLHKRGIKIGQLAATGISDSGISGFFSAARADW